jgi:F-type H+-transporting ATPase subunit epsilon
MAGTFNLKIITPERVVLDAQVEEVAARAIDGGFEVLPNHQPMITALAIDVFRYKLDGVEHHAAVMGGLLEVGENKVTVLSDVAELDAEIDSARAHVARDRAEAEKTTKTDKLDVYTTEMAMSKAITRLKAAELGKLRKRAPHTTNN